MKIIKANFIEKATGEQVFESIRFFEDDASEEKKIEWFRDNEISDEDYNDFNFSDEEKYDIKLESLSMLSWWMYLNDREKRIKKDPKLSKEQKEKALWTNEAVSISFCGQGGEYPWLFGRLQRHLESFLRDNEKISCLATGKENGEAIYSSEIPKVSFDDVVGMEEAKKAIRDKFIDPITYKEIYDTLKIRTGGGILMYGVPGTGKTMLAQAVAHEIDAEFFSVKCSDIMSKWFGESERTLKQLFAQARQKKKSVLYFDEIDQLAKKTNLASNCAATLIAEMKAQMQGVDNSNQNVLIIGATNHPELIDSAFLRPGRCDVRIYVELPSKEARKTIIRKRLEGYPHMLTENVINELGEKTEGFNCSDVDYLCQAAKIIAKDAIKDFGREHIRIEPQDFFEALKTVHSTTDMSEDRRLRNWRI